MESQLDPAVAAPLSYPNLALTIPYEAGLRYIQGRLQMIGSGELKPFCEGQQLPYTSVVSLKNGNTQRDEPRLVQRVLRSLAVPTELLVYPPGSTTRRFLLPDAKALATFQAQLAYLTSGDEKWLAQ